MLLACEGIRLGNGGFIKKMVTSVTETRVVCWNVNIYIYIKLSFSVLMLDKQCSKHCKCFSSIDQHSTDVGQTTPSIVTRLY